MIHERVTIDKSLPGFDDIDVVVSECHAIPQYITFCIGGVGLLSVPTLANHILYSIYLLSAVSCIDYYMLLILRRPHICRACHYYWTSFVAVFIILFLLFLFRSVVLTCHHNHVHAVITALSYGNIASTDLLLHFNWNRGNSRGIVCLSINLRFFRFFIRFIGY